MSDINEVRRKLARLVDDKEVSGLRAFVYRDDLSALLDDHARLRAEAAEWERLAAALEEAQMGLRYAVRVWVLSDEIEWSEAEIDEAVERIIGDAKKEVGRG